MAKVRIRLWADVVERDGRPSLKFKNEDYYHNQVAQFKGKKQVVVTIESPEKNRSLNQNNYWWGVCYPILSETTGYTTEEVHEYCKKELLPPAFVKIAGKTVRITKSTTKLSVGEGVEYTDNIRRLAVELGAYIPSPEEAGYISNKSAKVYGLNEKIVGGEEPPEGGEEN